MSAVQPFTLDLDLGPIPADLIEVHHEIGDQLASYDARLSRRHAHTWVSITVTGSDLWQAVLLAMVAVTGTGYPVRGLTAESL